MLRVFGGLFVALIAIAVLMTVGSTNNITPSNSQGSQPSLRFGIYPGGGVGTTSGSYSVTEQARRKQSALARLHGTRAFVLHEYVSYRNSKSLEGAQVYLEQLLQSAQGTSQLIELVVRYQPDRHGSVSGYRSMITSLVSEFRGRPQLVGIQITNEANQTGAPAASDGAYPRVMSALYAGVDAAARARGKRPLKIGFNVALQSGTSRFWNQLRRTRSASFLSHVDYVGVDVYPGTWPTTITRPLSQRQSYAVVHRAIADTRRYMSQSGFRAGTGLHFAEAGYPTGRGRSGRTQQRVLRGAVEAALAASKSNHYRVTDFRWFDLSDARTSSNNIELHYGLMTDRFIAKPAFMTYRALIARYGK